jgi:hypothetical protein
VFVFSVVNVEVVIDLVIEHIIFLWPLNELINIDLNGFGSLKNVVLIDFLIVDGFADELLLALTVLVCLFVLLSFLSVGINISKIKTTKI